MLSYEILTYFTQTVNGFGLFTSVLMDATVKDLLVLFDASESTLRRYIASFDPTLFAVYHPEYSFFRRNMYFNLFSGFGGELHAFLADKVHTFSVILPFSYLVQLVCVIYGVFLFTTLFFSFFSAVNAEEGAADVEFALVNLSVEAEKELFSAEDAKYLVIMFVALFGIYFGLAAFAFGPNANIALFFTGFLPFLVITVLMIPTNLLFDFGLLFLLYLRGASNTNSFFFELAYDYIGVTAFYTRLVVQFVRLVLMFVVYCMMHETVALQKITH
jgi:hypothetical protein